jgi:DNA-binding transcriptional ArsR family regulator
MRAKPEYRDRDDAEVAVLDALADRHQEGMTVFELRSRADVNIDQIEGALAALKADDLIEVEDDGERTVIRPEEHVVGTPDPAEDESLLEQLRRRLPL